MMRYYDCLGKISNINIGLVPTKEEWQVILLSDIAISLAMIADALEEQNKISKDGLRANKETSERMISDNNKYYEWMKSFAKGDADE